MNKPKFVIVNADDWQGLYKDGELVTEGHSVELHELASAADIELEELEADVYFDGYDHSRCPQSLDEITEVLDALKGKQ